SQVLAQRRIHPVSAKYRRHFGHDHERRKSGKKPGDVFLTVFVFLLHHPIVLQRPTVKVGHETSPRVRGGNKVTSPVKQVGNRFFHHHSGIPCSRTFPSNTGIAGQNSPDGQLLVRVTNLDGRFGTDSNRIHGHQGHEHPDRVSLSVRIQNVDDVSERPVENFFTRNRTFKH